MVIINSFLLLDGNWGAVFVVVVVNGTLQKFFLVRYFLEAGLDDSVCLHGGDGDVEHPEEDEA